MMEDYSIPSKLEGMTALVAAAHEAFNDGNKKELKAILGCIESDVDSLQHYIQLQEEKTA